MYAEFESPGRSALEEAVQGAISESLRFRSWPDNLRQEFARNVEDTDRQSLLFQQTVGLVVAFLTCAIDLWSIPEEAGRGLVLRAILILPVAAAVIAFSDKLTLRQMKIATTYTLTAFGALAMHLASFADPETAARYTMATALLLGMGILVLPLRTHEAAIFALVFIASTIIAGVWPNPVPSNDLIEHGLMILIIGGGGFAITVRLNDLKDRNFLLDLRDQFSRSALEQTNLVLRELAEKDELTGLPNRRSFHSVFEAEFLKGRGDQDIQTTLMMIDLDLFKKFNDQHGHQAGDRALQVVSRYLDDVFKDIDGTVARFGGEEFVAIFRCASVREAEAIGNRVRSEISELIVPVGRHETARITTSVGIASVGSASDFGLSDLTARADRALYAAKSGGRNRVVVSEHIELRVDRLFREE
jgi:diguanylate cyclase (GGDEF)-like protein